MDDKSKARGLPEAEGLRQSSGSEVKRRLNELLDYEKDIFNISTGTRGNDRKRHGIRPDSRQE